MTLAEATIIDEVLKASIRDTEGAYVNAEHITSSVLLLTVCVIMATNTVVKKLSFLPGYRFVFHLYVA
jgi:hypothetical protein